jgi:LPXTG-site transpeptidase (sortase) family protein
MAMRRVGLTLIVVLGLALASAATAGARRAMTPTISIPRIGVSAVIGTSLARGAVYWPSVGRPGQGTTIAIAGHDVTPVPGFDGHGPFHDINNLRKGDRIDINWNGTRHSYRVTGLRVIPSSDLHIADLTRYVLLTTCWPRGSSEYRLVVYARPA